MLKRIGWMGWLFGWIVLIGAVGCVKKVDVETADRYNKMGIAQLNKGHYEEAIHEFQKAIEMDPGYVKAHVNLGITLYGAERRDEAAKALGKAIELEPDQPNAQYTWGLI